MPRPSERAVDPALPEDRHLKIAELAYKISEAHDYDSQRTLENWLEAEAQIDTTVQNASAMM
ncbi:MAG: DUF2934 domain-containing protein [Halothiobacillus sp.]